MAGSVDVDGTATEGTANALIPNRTKREEVDDVAEDFPLASLQVQLSFVSHISAVCAE